MNAFSDTEATLLVRMPTRLRDAVKDTAAREDRSMASVIREALRVYVAKSARKRRAVTAASFLDTQETP